MMMSSFARIVRSFEVVNVESHAVVLPPHSREIAGAYITSRITVNTYEQCMYERVCVCAACLRALQRGVHERLERKRGGVLVTNRETSYARKSIGLPRED